MMNRRAKEIKKRIAKRKRKRMNSMLSSSSSSSDDISVPFINQITQENVQVDADSPLYVEAEGSKNFHPLFRSDVFITKLLISACIVLMIGIIFKNDRAEFLKARDFVSHMMEKEFNFAYVSKWYEEQFGNPLAFLKKQSKEESGSKESQYAVPASGKVLQSFKDTGQGVMIETNNKTVEAMNEGIVIEAGKKEDTGLTVVIQHADGIETWYGNLEELNVALYDFVETGKPVGKVKQSQNQHGTYYFAIKKGDTFIDPSQVISFE
ncbi:MULTISPECIES: M23 family metallopeptidase [Aeribacillus]|uniref:M23 family metallopeptidase n=1 Tax=Aeribacillus TaxID=1055323 RepID=UPI000E35755A|nr:MULTISPECIES: M23 family metallopeptidase [Aeribacillus]MED1442307.1 M23 family metallopeptidase [Aeribacillus composti]